MASIVPDSNFYDAMREILQNTRDRAPSQISNVQRTDILLCSLTNVSNASSRFTIDSYLHVFESERKRGKIAAYFMEISDRKRSDWYQTNQIILNIPLSLNNVYDKSFLYQNGQTIN